MSRAISSASLLGCAYLRDGIHCRSLSVSPCSSRPASRATSLCEGLGGVSSGYESSSARSHLGPHYSEHNMPRSNSPEPKYNSLKPRRRKQHQHQHRQQFYSLRLCRRHQQHYRRHQQHEDRPLNGAAGATSYQLYAIPIYHRSTSCPHKTVSTTTLATSLGDSTNGDEPPPPPLPPLPPPPQSVPILLPPPPIPAPRCTRKTNPSEHTYQNVPSPVFPQRDSTRSEKLPVCLTASCNETRSDSGIPSLSLDTETPDDDNDELFFLVCFDSTATAQTAQTMHRQ